MHVTTYLLAGAAGAALVGLAAALAVVYFAPLLVSHRVESPLRPERSVLVPFAGGYRAGWHPVRTVLWEVVCVAIPAALWLHEAGTVQRLLACAYALVLLTIAYIDIDYRLVPNRISYPAALLAILLAQTWPYFGWRSALEGAIFGFVVFWFLEVVGRGSLGSGDTTLVALIGAMRGFPGIVAASAYGVALGGFAAAFFMVALRRGRKAKIAYAPYLVAGALISFFTQGP